MVLHKNLSEHYDHYKDKEHPGLEHGQFESCVDYLCVDVANNITQYDRVFWLFFTDGGSSVPKE